MLSARAVLFSVMLLCGCSHQQAGEAHKPANLIEAGKNLSFPHCSLYVQKRAGNSLDGIRLVTTNFDGIVSTITADKGDVSEEGSHLIRVTLYNAKAQSKTGREFFKEMVVNLPLPFFRAYYDGTGLQP